MICRTLEMLTALTIFSTGHFLVGGIALSGVRSIRTASRPQTTAVVYTAMAQVGIIRVASRSCVLLQRLQRWRKSCIQSQRYYCNSIMIYQSAPECNPHLMLILESPRGLYAFPVRLVCSWCVHKPHGRGTVHHFLPRPT